jgi:hypothetical protein
MMCAVDHPGPKSDVRQEAGAAFGCAEDAPQVGSEPQKRECSHHPDVRADEVACVVVAVGEVVGDLLLGRVRVRNIGHEEGAGEHQKDEDDAAERGPAFQLPAHAHSLFCSGHRNACTKTGVNLERGREDCQPVLAPGKAEKDVGD